MLKRIVDILSVLVMNEKLTDKIKHNLIIWTKEEVVTFA